MIFNPIFVGNNNKVVFSYTGNYTNTEYVSSEGTKYSLYTLTSSGILSAKMKNADIWVCGGGQASKQAQYFGGGGAFCKQLDSQNLDGEYIVSIAAAGGETVLENQDGFELASGVIVVSISVTAGTGGGGGNGYSGRNGDGKTKYPFSDETNFNCHCAGGGGGGGYHVGNRRVGGKGGTNGGNGSNSTSSSYSMTGGDGGEYGGGKGGTPTTYDAVGGGAATFYGGGGGGAGYFYNNASTTQRSSGAGYQGVVYIRVPA